jgi:uncharacterized protein (TIGR03083 family)
MALRIGAKGRPNTDYRAQIRQEGERLVSDLEQFNSEQWAAPTLCENWSVRTVVAHLTPGGYGRLIRIFAGAIRYRGDIDRSFDEDARARASLPTDQLLADYRAAIADYQVPPIVTPALIWCDNVIHGCDIRRPLGIEDLGPIERFIDVVECLRSMTWPSRKGCRAHGLSFEATDVAWEAGDGPQVQGPIETAPAGRA